MMKKCVVLLATYNGQKYLREQLDSILAQKCSVDLSIYIRDDGSTDSTKNIIEEYSAKYPKQIGVEYAENVGAQASFMELIRKAPDADYYAFADQDDVWKEDKIEVAVKRIGEGNGPMLYTANYSLCDKDLHVVSEQEVQKKPQFTPIRCMMYNRIPGCTMIFNKCLLGEMNKVSISNVRMHDIFCLVVAVLRGKVFFDEKSYILHRIHENNVIGIGHKKVTPLTWLKEKASIVIHKENYDMSELAQALLTAFSDELKQKDKNDLLLVANFKRNYWQTIKLLHHPETKQKFGRETLSIRAKILLHLF